MYYHTTSSFQIKSIQPSSTSRKGITLIIVISMLALFAIVGVAFVYYATSEATASKMFRESKNAPRPELQPDVVFNQAMAQLIYGPVRTEAGRRSALWGHSLATTMYGYDINSPNTVPFNGMGRPHFDYNIGGTMYDNYNLINYSVDHARTPENGLDVPFTYPDLNNMAMSAINAKGEILIPSFHRPWLFGALDDTTNPNWTNNVGKYYLLRPRPQEHSGFPFPEDGGGDVKNWYGGPGIPIPGNPGKYYVNDSVWMDIGMPIMTSSNGTKFRPLVAFLVVDLDGKVNLNVHGNLTNKTKGTKDPDADDLSDRDHRSHQGWGAWEVSLKPIFNKDTNKTEWKYIFRGRTSLDDPKTPISLKNRIFPRYGKVDKLPGNVTDESVGLRKSFRFYSQLDWDGRSATGSASGWLLPGNSTASPFVPFPKFNTDRYGNADIFESVRHPSLENYFGQRTKDTDQHFGMFEMDVMFRYNDTGSPFLQSHLFRLCPQNFSSEEVRRLVTVLSMDVNRPGAGPWLYNTGSTAYEFTPPDAMDPDPAVASTYYPKGAQVDHFSGSNNPPAMQREFGKAGGQAIGGSRFTRLDLSALAGSDFEYSDPIPNGKWVYDLPAGGNSAFEKATRLRQEFARELFNRLRYVTKGEFPNDPLAEYQTSEYNAQQYLAQLAVNIVDYIDNDDIVTPFNWLEGQNVSGLNDNGKAPKFLFGTEMPKVVLNEVYSEVANHFSDIILMQNKAVNPYQVRFWCELYNVNRSDSSYGDVYNDGSVDLQNQDAKVYRIEILKRDKANIASFDNVRGEPNNANDKLVSDTFANDLTSPVSLKPLPEDEYYSGRASKDGFFVVGPENFSGLTVSYKTNNMRYEVPVGDVAAIGDLLKKHTILLRRLACPKLPHEDDETSPFYNPYITVDYIEDLTTYNGLSYFGNGTVTKTDEDQRFSKGSKQPFASHYTQVVNQAPAESTGRQHTFFRHNGKAEKGADAPVANDTIEEKFDWLVHLDRELISPMELLHVSAFPPHMLTQRFKMGSDKFQHQAHWFDPEARLYRLFEFVQTGTRARGVDTHGRIPGKININSIWDERIFQALCDPQPGSRFSKADVTAIYNNMIAKRTPNNGIPGPNDKPFRGLAIGYGKENSVTQRGIDDTFLRTTNGGDQTARRMFQPTDDPLSGDSRDKMNHPYERFELMTKIYNNVTTRSNTFAVFMTVGFFEVKDDTPGAVKLGPELGKSEGRHKRYRYFAIVDRTKLGVFPSKITNISNFSTFNGPGVYEITLNNSEGLLTPPGTSANPSALPPAKSWAIKKGMGLILGNTGSDKQEQVVVLSDPTSDNKIQAYCRYEHVAGENVSLVGVNGDYIGSWTQTVYGHPGPQPRFDPRAYPRVVPYFTRIE